MWIAPKPLRIAPKVEFKMCCIFPVVGVHHLLKERKLVPVIRCNVSVSNKSKTLPMDFVPVSVHRQLVALERQRSRILWVAHLPPQCTLDTSDDAIIKLDSEKQICKNACFSVVCMRTGQRFFRERHSQKGGGRERYTVDDMSRRRTPSSRECDARPTALRGCRPHHVVMNLRNTVKSRATSLLNGWCSMMLGQNIDAAGFQNTSTGPYDVARELTPL